jgi:hypothetical protein
MKLPRTGSACPLLKYMIGARDMSEYEHIRLSSHNGIAKILLRKLRAPHIPSILFLRHRRRSPHARPTHLPQTKIFGFDELAPV